MSILIEGVDLTGKTTLANNLAIKLGLPLFDVCAYGEDVFPRDMKAAEAIELISIRWFPTAVIYRGVEGKPSPLTRAQKWKLGLAACRSGSVFVHLLAEDRLLRIRHEERGDSKWPIEHILLVKAAYEEKRPIWTRYLPEKRITGSSTEAHMVGHVHAAYLEGKELSKFCPSTGTGSLQPKIIVVVDEEDPLLFDVLELCDLRPMDVHLIEAEMMERAVWRYFDRPLTVTFGEPAGRHLADMGISIIGMPYLHEMAHFSHIDYTRYILGMKEVYDATKC